MKHLVAQGMPEEEAKTEVSRGKPPELLVPTFNKLGTETLRRHLVTAHNATVASTAPTGSTITNHFQKTSTIDKVALMLTPACRSDWWMTPFFYKHLGHQEGANLYREPFVIFSTVWKGA